MVLSSFRSAVDRIVGTTVVLCVAATSLAQQVRFDDVIRNLRNPDPKVRLASVQLLRESKYPEAIGPLAPLVNDPVDQIQLEAIATELSFFLTQDVPSKKRLGYVVEVRNPAHAQAAFDMGTLALESRLAPPDLVDALLKAIDDDNAKVRSEAIYTVGTVARSPLSESQAAVLIKSLDHYDPAIRAAAARVTGRLSVSSAADALIHAINDSQAPVRYAAMRSLGLLGERRAIQALTEQLNFYGKGEGAWSALDALAHIADPSSVPLFKVRLKDLGALKTTRSSRRFRSQLATTHQRWCGRQWPSRSRNSDATTFPAWSNRWIRRRWRLRSRTTCSNSVLQLRRRSCPTCRTRVRQSAATSQRCSVHWVTRRRSQRYSR
jgi:HEAT repeat protein